MLVFWSKTLIEENGYSLVKINNATCKPLLSFSSAWLFVEKFSWSYQATDAPFGWTALIISLCLVLAFKEFPKKAEQTKQLVLKNRYWLFYDLTFFSGARRQIFMIFVGFLMVEKFHYSVPTLVRYFLLTMFLIACLPPKLVNLLAR